MSSKTTTRVSSPPPSAAEAELQELNLELAKIQLQEIRRDQELFDKFITPEERAQFEEQQFERSIEFARMSDELLKTEFERIQSGGAATPEQKRLIGESVTNAIGLGESDIKRFQEQGINLIASELAPSLGLRKGDTPLIDRGGEIAEEGARQQGQLVRNLRGIQAREELGFPLQAGQVLSAQTQAQQGLSMAATDFQQQLRQQAFNNRLRLTGGVGAVAQAGQLRGLNRKQTHHPSQLDTFSQQLDLGAKVAMGVGQGLVGLGF
jgi:hypothetical protein